MNKISNQYFVQSIDATDYKPWLLKKHYAHRIPPITYAFGSYTANKKLQGVCTFGPPARMLNDGYGCFGDTIKMQTTELNRLVVNDGLGRNVLSWFVSHCLRNLPIPHCVVSYADGSHGHHGYIYQSTNWKYTGVTATEKVYIDKRNQEIIHPRTIVSMFGSRELNNLPEWIEVSKEELGKHRYFQFLGNRKEKAEMLKRLKYPILPYPKGDNQRYDASYKPKTQDLLF